jgi:hypothetical protein
VQGGFFLRKKPLDSVGFGVQQLENRYSCNACAKVGVHLVESDNSGHRRLPVPRESCWGRKEWSILLYPRSWRAHSVCGGAGEYLSFFHFFDLWMRVNGLTFLCRFSGG